MSEKEKTEIVFEIREHLGVIGAYPTGWQKELNLVAWNGTPPKYDIRDWDHDHEHMSRGITMHKDEMKKLVQIVKRQGILREFFKNAILHEKALRLSVVPPFSLCYTSFI